MKNIVKKIFGKIKINSLPELIILIIIAAVPVYFNYFYASSVELNKTIFFRVLLLFLLFFTIWKFAFTKLQFHKDNLITILLPMGAFFLSLAVSIIFAVDFNSAWFGSFDRNEGLLSYLFYGLWFILLLFNLNDLANNKSSLKRLSIAISLSASLVSIYAISQFFGYDFLTWSEPANITKRAYSSLGQPNYLACWLVMVMPMTAYLFYSAKRLGWRIICIILFLLQLGALFSTGSRSAFLAFFVISFIWLFIFFIKEKDFFRKYFLRILISGLVVFFIFITALFIVNPTRVTEFSNFKNGSISIRIDLWQNGLKAFLQKPIFGYGLENQKEAYVKYYQPEGAVYAQPNTYSDRAHNLLLDILLTTGIVGLIAFIYLMWVVFNNLWKSYRQQDNKFSIFLIWSLAAYLLVLLFNFSITVTNIYFFLFIALAFLLSGSIYHKTEEKYKQPVPYLMMIAAIIVLFYGIISEIKILEADYYFNKSLTAISEKQFFSAFLFNEYLLEAEPNSLMKMVYGQSISLRLIESLPPAYDRTNNFVINKYLVDFSDQIKSQDFESRFVKAFILGVTNNRVQSEEMFKQLVSTSPNLPKIYLAWGDVYLHNNNPQKAKLKFEKALSLLPSLDNIYLNNDHKAQLKYYYSLIDSRLQQVNNMINK